MDDAVGKVIAALFIIGAVIIDWPRAMAGLVVGYCGKRVGYWWLVVPAGVAAVSLLGEVIYPLIGWSDGMSWSGFWFGIVSAGATAVGLFRVLWNITESPG